MMEPRIETLPKTQLIGVRMTVSITDNKTRELWQAFMPRRNELSHSVDNEFYSVEVYDSPDFFTQFDPKRPFQQWAAMKVSGINEIPHGMEYLLIPESLYAVFTYRGKSSEARQAFIFIYGTWIPDSEYELDDRPHFAVMGSKYKNDDPESEEELWIPVKKGK